MFSVIIPVHNKLPHLERSINSVLNQSFENFELLLIDDASTDGSTEKLLEFKDPRIRRFRREIPGPGGYAARNLGIKEAKYDWIAFLDADDEWMLTHLEEKMNAINKHKNLNVISSKWNNNKSDVFYENKPLKNTNNHKEQFFFKLQDFLISSHLVWTGAVMIKKDLLIKVGMFPEDRCKRGGDLDTWIRCLYQSQQNIYINKTLSTYCRETINQVTNRESNPIKDICMLPTLINLRDNSKDEKLLKAIDVLLFKKVYEILKSSKLSKSERIFYLKQIKSFRKRTLLQIRLILRNTLVLIGVVKDLK